MFDADAPGQDQRLRLPGLQPADVGAQQGQDAGGACRSSSSWSSIDPLETETARFWENHGEFNDVDPVEDPDRGVHAAVHLLRRGRGLAHQLQPRAALALEGGRSAGRSRARDIEIMADLFMRLRKRLREGRRQRCRADPGRRLELRQAETSPTPDELLKEINGKALVDLQGPDRRRRKVLSSRPASSSPIFAQMRDDGTTVGRQLDLHRRLHARRQHVGAARQRRSVRPRRPSATGASPGRPTGACSTTAPRPTLHGKPWSERKKYIAWDGTKWTGPRRAGLSRRPLRPTRAPAPSS